LVQPKLNSWVQQLKFFFTQIPKKEMEFRYPPLFFLVSLFFFPPSCTKKKNFKMLKRMCKLGIRYIENNNIKGSFEIAKTIFNIRSDSAYGYYLIGYIKQTEKKYPESLQYYTFCANLLKCPSKHLILRIARIQFELQMYRKSMATFQSVIRLFPKDSSGYNGKGICLRKLGFVKRSIEAFSEAIKTEAFPKVPLMNRARTWAEINEFENAIVDYNILATLFGDNYNEREGFLKKRDKCIQLLKGRLFFYRNTTQTILWD
jgi:tetratricopeptide (TPR) repeat protein